MTPLGITSPGTTLNDTNRGNTTTTTLNDTYWGTTTTTTLNDTYQATTTTTTTTTLNDTYRGTTTTTLNDTNQGTTTTTTLNDPNRATTTTTLNDTNRGTTTTTTLNDTNRATILCLFCLPTVPILFGHEKVWRQRKIAVLCKSSSDPLCLDSDVKKAKVPLHIRKVDMKRKDRCYECE